MMKRRDFITLLGGAAAAWPLAARAQQEAKTIGFLHPTSSDAAAKQLSNFREGLAEIGYVEGRNVTIEYRWADGYNDRLPGLAVDLVARHVNVIAAPAGLLSVRAAKAATATIPIVFNTGVDPIQLGLVASLNRPGGNLTGVTTLDTELIAKRLQLLHEMVPTATVIAALLNLANPNGGNLSKDLQAAARTLGLQLRVLNASTDRDLDTVFANLAEMGAGALVIAPDLFLNARRAQLTSLALSHSVPTISQFPEFASAGGLMSYGSDLLDAVRQVGVYTGRILKGDKPADLPVQQATKIELVINLKTAKMLGLDVPGTLLVRADEVIE
jgi:ABC-type uncharacterized transport system substrate-binding protein